jgi:hypothetical protein
MNVDKEFLDALETVLDEFGACDLGPRLNYFLSEGDEEAADQLNGACVLLAEWLKHQRPTWTAPWECSGFLEEDNKANESDERWPI